MPLPRARIRTNRWGSPERVEVLPADAPDPLDAREWVVIPGVHDVTTYVRPGDIPELVLTIKVAELAIGPADDDGGA